MKISTSILFTSILAFFISNNLIAQEYKKNSIYVNIGSIIFQSQYSISGERTIFTKDNFRTKAKVSLGRFTESHYDLDDGAKEVKSYATLSVVQLLSIFELGLGGGINTYNFTSGIEVASNPPEYYDEEHIGFQPAVNAGLRFEKKHFLFRLGAGYPELFYAGIGCNF